MADGETGAIRRIPHAVPDLACSTVRALENLAADHQPGPYPRAEGHENANLAAGQRAPPRLRERRRVHVVGDGDRRYAEAVSQHRWKRQAIPARQVRRQLDASLGDDPGAHGADSETVARRALPYTLRCRECPLNGFSRSPLRVRLDSI